MFQVCSSLLILIPPLRLPSVSLLSSPLTVPWILRFSRWAGKQVLSRSCGNAGLLLPTPLAGPFPGLGRFRPGCAEQIPEAPCQCSSLLSLSTRSLGFPRLPARSCQPRTAPGRSCSSRRARPLGGCGALILPTSQVSDAVALDILSVVVQVGGDPGPVTACWPQSLFESP